MSGSDPVVPEAAADLRVPARTPTSKAFECARQRLSQLRDQEALWDQPVTREDVEGGVLETGNFHEDDISGFRLRLRHDRTSNTVALRLRGAGAYFVDQGVDAGLQEFRAGLEPCLAAQR